jgi:hypothetical protein
MAVAEFAMQRRKRVYRVSIEPPLERASGGIFLQRPLWETTKDEPANEHVISRLGAPGRRARAGRDRRLNANRFHARGVHRAKAAKRPAKSSGRSDLRYRPSLPTRHSLPQLGALLPFEIAVARDGRANLSSFGTNPSSIRLISDRQPIAALPNSKERTFMRRSGQSRSA